MAAVWPAGPEPIIASFECMPRFCMWVASGARPPVAAEAVFFWLKATAAAETGSEIEDLRGKEDARRKKAEENTLAVVGKLEVKQ